MSIDISEITPEEQLFHNEKINTYHTYAEFEEISYWEENLRTLFAFDLLEDITGKELQDIELEEVTYFLAGRDELNLIELAESIEKNGVRVPLIILDDGTLLDGNRRFFACSYIYHEGLKNNNRSDVLNRIPVWVILEKDIDEIKKHKILAEANFVNDMKVPWTLDVKARVIADYYSCLIRDGCSEQEAYIEIKDVYDEQKSKVRAYVESVQLVDEYINQAGSDKARKFKLRQQVLKKFVYFWEFRNKALNGRGKLDESELLVVKPLFFKMMENGFFKNMKQVEPMARSYRDKYLWDILNESQGTKISQVEILYREKKTIKSAEDKVRNFLRWLDDVDNSEFTYATHKLLEQLSAIIERLNNGE